MWLTKAHLIFRPHKSRQRTSFQPDLFLLICTGISIYIFKEIFGYKLEQLFGLLISIIDWVNVSGPHRKPGSYVLSYLGRTGINHFRVTAVCGDFYIGGRQFDSLQDLIGRKTYNMTVEAVVLHILTFEDFVDPIRIQSIPVIVWYRYQY